MKKGITLPTHTIVIVILLLFVLAVLASFFLRGSNLMIKPIIGESRIDKECNNWKYHWYSYGEFNNTNYPILVEKFGNPVRAGKYCQDLNAEIDIVGGCDFSKCDNGIIPGWASDCCCENTGDSDCDDGETNCGWGTYC